MSLLYEMRQTDEIQMFGFSISGSKMTLQAFGIGSRNWRKKLFKQWMSPRLPIYVFLSAAFCSTLGTWLRNKGQGDYPEDPMDDTSRRQKSKPKRRSFYFTLLTAFSILAILIVFSTTLLFTGLFINDTYRQLEDNGLRQLSGCRDEFDRIFMQAREINQYLRQNPDFSSYLYSDEPDMIVINRARLTFSQVQYINPYIRSIVFFNRSFPYDLSNLRTGKDGLDVASLIGKTLQKPDMKTELTLAYSTLVGKPMAGINPRTSLSIVFGEMDEDRIGEEAVIVTLDPDEIEKKLLGALDGITYAADAGGNILFSNAEYMAGDSVSSQEYFRRILESDSLSGSMHMRIGDEEQSITYTHGLSGGYLLVNVRPTGGFLHLIRGKIMLIGVISIVVILVYLFAGVLLSRRISDPMRRMKEIIERNSVDTVNGQRGELAFMTEVFEQVTRQKHELEEVNADQAARLKTDILRNLLTVPVLADDLQALLARCRCSISFRNLQTVCILIDRYRQFEPDRQYILDNALDRIIPQVLKPSFDCECVRIRPGEMAILLNASERNKTIPSKGTESMEPCEGGTMTEILPATPDRDLIQNLVRLRQLIRGSFGITLTVAVEGLSDGPEACRVAYDAARELANARLTRGLDMILTRSEVEEAANASEKYPIEIEQELLSAIRQGKPVLFENHLDTLLMHLSSFHYQKASSVLIQVVAACIRVFNECLSPEKGYQAIGFDLFTTAFGEMETLQDAKPWLMDVHAGFLERQAEYSLLKSSRQYGLVEKTREYIETHYTDTNLSMDAIAAQNGYTPYYYSKLFKELSGIGINDCIRSVRLEKAKKLLAETTMKTQEISDLVGFANISSFYLSFKKEIGMTPAIYRECTVSGAAGG